MKPDSTLLTRRAALALGGLGLTTLVVTPAAFAAPGLHFPLKLAYGRIGPDGFIAIRTDEQVAWTAMQMRLGGLIAALEPIQPGGMLGAQPPEVDGGASCALAGRKLAADLGFDYVVLYATQDGRKDFKTGGGWLRKTFSSLRSEYGKYDRARGEAHLLSVAGGAPLISTTADADPRSPFNLFDNNRNPERETLTTLTRNIEGRLQDLARTDYAAQRSIGD
jgi:hypothetical protein